MIRWPRLIGIGILGFAGATCLAQSDKPAQDEFGWLEEVNGAKALDWVATHNDTTLKELEKDQKFKANRESALAILNAKDRIPYGQIMGNMVYNHWQDDQHVKGLWRRQTLDEYTKASANWETLVDIDALAVEMKMPLVFKGANCLAPQYRLCLLSLSDGGKDAVYLREFDTKTKSFVTNGFTHNEAKTSVTWLDSNALAIATDFGPGSLTEAGYARMVKIWHRGKKLEDEPVLFSAEVKDTWVHPYVIRNATETFFFIERALDFYHKEIYLVANGLQPERLPLPASADVDGLLGARLIVEIKEPWLGRPGGSLVAVNLNNVQGKTAEKLEIADIFIPNDKRSISEVSTLGSKVLVTFLDNVKSASVYYAIDQHGKVKTLPLLLPKSGVISIVSADSFSDRTFVTYEDFLTPPTLYYAKDADTPPAKVRSLPAQFDASGLAISQYEAKSSDGTQVPYFVVHAQGIKFNKNNPTLLYGYGGFEIPMLPRYLGVRGKLWLEQGGTYTLANIRGGGEFGPAWHDAALKHNRQKAYEDFFAVTQDLFSRGVTSPAKLGIMGGSNGGLLMGAAFTQKPEFYAAVVCQVPLLDMLRFHKLLAGASWMAEYGNPDVAEDAAYLKTYSPYHVVEAQKKYPEVFFITSTRDDRVHPGHARKMAAKMQKLGHRIYYYENTHGGHAASADNIERAKMMALEFTYLMRKLMPASS